MEHEPASADFLVGDRTTQPSIEEINDWVRQAQSGCGKSLAGLYSHFQPGILEYAARRVGPDDAEDVASRIFLKVLGGLANYGLREGVPFKGWLYVIAKNEARDHMRAKRDTVQLYDIADQSPLVNPLARAELNEDLD